MNCLCFKKKRDRKASTNGKTGVANLAYNQGEDVDDNLDNNAVLDELNELDSTADTPDTGKVTPSEQRTTPITSKTPSTTQVEITSSYKAGDPRTALLTAQQTAKITLTPASSVNTQDDNYVGRELEECVEVDLTSKDSIGLGVSVTGTLTDGIIISEMSEKGSASQSGKVSIGDRILSVTISFDNMVYEDALTILSYASPYPVSLKLSQKNKLPANLNQASATSSKQNRVCHPVYRSQSLEGNSGSSKRQKALPPRPGTSLGQIECLAKQEDVTLDGDSLLQSKLVKDKFGNTLNLINATDTTLHTRQEEEASISQYDSRSEDCRSNSSDSINSSSGIKVSTVLEVNSAPPYSPVSNSSSQPPEKPKRIYLTELAGISDQPYDSHTGSEPASELAAADEIEESIVAPESAAKQRASLSDVEGETLETRSTVHKRTMSEILREFDKPLLEDNIMMIEYEKDANTPVAEAPIVSTKKIDSESTVSFRTPSIEPASEPPEDTECQISTSQIGDVALIDSHDDRIDSVMSAECSELIPETTHEQPESAGDASNDVVIPESKGDDTCITASETELKEEEGDDEEEEEEEEEEDPIQRQKRLQEEEENVLLRHTRRSLLTSRRTSSGSSSSLLDDSSSINKASTRSQLEAARARFFAELMQSSDLFKDSPRNSLSLGSDKPLNNNDSTVPSQELSAQVASDSNC